VEKQHKTLDLDEVEAQAQRGGELHTSYCDIWGPGIPHGWLQVKPVDMPDSKRGFFCSGECYVTWLKTHGRDQEAEAFKYAVWIA
jgi:hypothetical protein